MTTATIALSAQTARIACVAMADTQRHIEAATAAARVDGVMAGDDIFGAPAAYDEAGALARWLDCEAVIAQILARPAQDAAEYETRVALAIHYAREDALRAAGDIAAIERNTIA